MIVVDENLHSQRIMTAISIWYPGQVISVTKLRPHSVIKDEAIPLLLRQANQPTFVTINVADFWQKAEPHGGYCLINIDLPKEHIREIPELLRRLLRLPHFKTKTVRMGKIVYMTPHQLKYYERDWQVYSLPWPG